MLVRIGAIEIGGIAQLELSFLAERGGVDVVAGADISPPARDLFEAEFDASAYDDYRAMIDAHAGELNGVLVATPHALHYEHARPAWKPGCTYSSRSRSRSTSRTPSRSSRSPGSGICSSRSATSVGSTPPPGR